VIARRDEAITVTGWKGLRTDFFAANCANYTNRKNGTWNREHERKFAIFAAKESEKSPSVARRGSSRRDDGALQICAVGLKPHRARLERFENRLFCRELRELHEQEKRNLEPGTRKKVRDFRG